MQAEALVLQPATNLSRRKCKLLLVELKETQGSTRSHCVGKFVLEESMDLS